MYNLIVNRNLEKKDYNIVKLIERGRLYPSSAKVHIEDSEENNKVVWTREMVKS